MTKRIIQIPTHKGDCSVSAFIFGKWAVHEDFQKFQEEKPVFSTYVFAITHIKTGLKLPFSVVGNIQYSLEQCLDLSAALDEQVHEDAGIDYPADFKRNSASTRPSVAFRREVLAVVQQFKDGLHH